MDVVVVFNGLGNQMSQYAFYTQKKAKNKSTYFFSFCSDHNGFELGKLFNIEIPNSVIEKVLYLIFRLLLTDKIKLVLSPIKWVLKQFNCKIIIENFEYNFNEAYIKPSKGIVFYYGGWHSEKYFVAQKKQIIEKFRFKEIRDAENLAIINLITHSNSVSLHVRRGDYLNAENIELFGKVCTKDYFEAAIETIKDKVSNPCFFVFSNDMDWVKNNLSLPNATYITNNKGVDSWKDMYLMSICKHNIISNSSFSWWGAWLNTSPDKMVVSPKRYLNNDITTDFYPESWIKLSDY